MKSFMFFFLIFLAQFVDLSGCDCFDERELDKIQCAIRLYKDEADRNFFWEVPLNPFNPWLDLPREKWEYPYHERIKKLNAALLFENVRRYPAIYHNILLYDQKIDVMADYQYEKAYMRYFGQDVPYIPYSQAEKEAMVAKDRGIARKYEKKTRDALDDLTTKVTNIYLKLHEECIKWHVNLQTYRDYGLLAHLNNNFEIAFDILLSLMNEAARDGQLDFLDAEFYHELGSVCIEALEYNKAIEYLTESIRKNPGNKAAYFNRAIAHFETGSFDFALEDYRASDKGESLSLDNAPLLDDFSNAFLTSALQGAAEAAVDFVPTMCSSIYGMGKVLWAISDGPFATSIQVALAAKKLGECAANYCKNIDWDTIEGYSENIKALSQSYDYLSDAKKGELIGHAIGKYGVDIFAGGAAFKMIKALRELKQANQLCNLEAMAASEANKDALLASACKHASEREAFFKNVKIQWDKQKKHIEGSHNFKPGKSIFEHKDPQKLLNKFAGKGRKMNNEIPGNPGYKELVDFQEHIGIWKDKQGQLPLPTTKGTIHYAKDGAHIVPAHPDAKVWENWN